MPSPRKGVPGERLGTDRGGGPGGHGGSPQTLGGAMRTCIPPPPAPRGGPAVAGQGVCGSSSPPARPQRQERMPRGSALGDEWHAISGERSKASALRCRAPCARFCSPACVTSLHLPSSRTKRHKRGDRGPELVRNGPRPRTCTITSSCPDPKFCLTPRPPTWPGLQEGRSRVARGGTR